MNLQAIATVVAVTGKAFARNANLEVRALKPGDTLLEGETIITSADSHVELSFMDGSTMDVPADHSMLIATDLVQTGWPGAEESALAATTPEDLLQALAEGRDIDTTLEAPAAGLEGGETGDGNDFVRLLRITEEVSPQTYAFESPPVTEPPIFEQGLIVEEEEVVPPSPSLSVSVSVTVPPGAGGGESGGVIISADGRSASLIEGTDGLATGKVVHFTIQLDQVFDQDVQVTYQIVPGTATAGNLNDFFDGPLTGTVTIPLMKRLGFRPELAGAVEATASTGGLVMPPVMGAVAFIMADFLDVSYGAIVVAAVIPAILYYTAILIQVDLVAGAQGMKGLPPEEIPRVADVLKAGWPFLLPLFVLIVLLVAFNWDPSRAGMASVFFLLAVGYWYVRDWRLARWYRVLAEAGEGTVEVIAVSALVGLIIATADKTGLGFTLALPLLKLGETSLILALVATALVSLVLGMGLPGIAIYMMQVALFVPGLIKLGVTPLSAHFFIMYFGTFSRITPPVCLSAFAAAAIARASPMRTGLESCKLGIVAFVVPFLFAVSPPLLGHGELWLVALNTATACAGVFAISVALRGFLMRPVGILARIAYGLVALGLALPTEVFDGALAINLVSSSIGAILIAGHLLIQPQALKENRHGY